MPLRGPLLLGIVLLVAVVAFFALGGYEAVMGSGDASDTTTEDEGDALRGSNDASQDASEAKTRRRGPSLFGLKREERVGKGALLGSIKNWDTKSGVANARITVQGKGYGDEPIDLSTTSDESGRFLLVDLPASDELLVTVAAEGLPGRAIEGTRVEARTETDLGEIWLGQGGVLRGRVLGPDELGIAGAQVEVHPDFSDMQQFMSNFVEVLSNIDKDPVPVAAGRSREQGRFEIPEVPPGPFSLIVRAPGHVVSTTHAVMESEGAAGGELVVRLMEADPVVGRVQDSKGRPVAEARVAVMPQSETSSGLFGRQYTDTDNAGRFEIQSPPLGGRLVAVVAHPNYATTFQPITLTDEDIVIVIEGGARLTVVMTEKETGRPIEGMGLLVILTEEGGRPDAGNLLSARTDHRGEATFAARPAKIQMIATSHDELGAGVWVGQAAMAGLVTGIEGPDSSVIKPGENRMVFKVARGVLLEGTITDPDGKPLKGASVSAASGFFGMGGKGPRVRTGDDGTYRLSVTPGMMGVQFSVEHPSYVQPNDSRRIDSDKVKERGYRHDVQMQRTITVVGQVVDGSGAPVPNARVRLDAQGESSNPMAAFMGGTATLRAMTNKDGRYVIGGVIAGKYRTIATRTGYVDSQNEAFELKGSGMSKAPKLVLERGVSVQVLVREPEGRLKSGARVELDFEREGDSPEFDPMQRFTNTGDRITDKNGVATLEGLAAGEGTITVSASGFAPGKATFTISKGTPITEPIEVRLERAFPITGTVVDTEGKPQARVPLFLNRRGEREVWQAQHTTVSDSKGNFSFDSVSEGDYQLVARSDKFRVFRIEVQGGQTGIDVRLAPVSRDTRKRLDELQTEMAKIGMRYASAKNDEERAALAKEIQVIQQEMQKLQTEVDPDAPELETEVVLEEAVVPDAPIREGEDDK